MLLIPSLLLLSGLVCINRPAWADNHPGCVTTQILEGVLASDFSIETIYPKVKVKVGVVNRSSKAFVLWRQKTPPHIPDSAFNAHYYTETQRKLAAKNITATVTDRIFDPALTINLSAQKHVRDFYDAGSRAYSYNFVWEFTNEANPTRLANAHFGSVEAMFKEFGIQPRLTEKTLDEILAGKWSGRFFVLGDGNVYVISEAETQRLNRALKTQLTHVGFAHLFFHGSPIGKTGKVDLIEMGYILHSDKPEKFHVTANSSFDFTPKPVQKLNMRQFLLDLKQAR